METNTETTEQPAQFLDSNDVGCPKCGKPFKNTVALRMHNARVHSKTLGQGYRWKARQSHNWDASILEKERLARKTRYQKKLRERYYREGKNSRGQQMPPGWKPRGKGGVVGTKWTPERKAKFRRTMRKKAMQRAGAQLFEAGGEKPAKRIQIVYPNPLDEAPLNLGTVTIPSLKFCPNCGEHLEGWRHS